MARGMSWWEWHRLRHDAQDRGVRDGRGKIPGWDDPQSSPYEYSIKQMVDQWVMSVVRGWDAADKRLLSSWRQAKAALRDAKKHKEDRKKDLAEARAAYKKKFGEDPEHASQPRPFLYVGFFILLFFGELPLNAVAMRLLQLPEPVTYVVAIVLALALLGASHHLGVSLKEGFSKEPTRAAVAGALSIISLLGLIAVAFLREQSIAQAAGEGTLASNEKWITVAFLALNLLIFVVATATSYFAWNPLLAAVLLARRRVVAAEQELTRADNWLQSAAATRAKTFEAACHQADNQNNALQELIGIYRVHNLEVRDAQAERANSTMNPAPHKPLSFTQAPPQATIPDILITYLPWPEAEGSEPVGSLVTPSAQPVQEEENS